MRAVRFDRYGGLEVLEVREVETPSPGPGEVLVRVRAAGINPGEASIREGRMHARFPATFPSGEGSDLAGVVERLGENVTEFALGDEVLGWTDGRASHAELVIAPVDQLVKRPPGISWEAAGALSVVGRTAWAAVRAVSPAPGDTVVVSGAAGGVGSLAVQLVVLAEATAIGLAGTANHEWLREHGVLPVAYGDGVEERIRAAAPNGVDAFIDTFGGGYVDLALALGVRPERIDTIIDFEAAARHEGVKMEGSQAGSSTSVIDELTRLIGEGRLELPIARSYPLAQVRDAFRELEARHTRGKIVLEP